ncbi:MAG: dUTP diphosphatase [Ruminococcus sp.]|nr:dUTP diphosphatase [Ruminococcus sp.]
MSVLKVMKIRPDAKIPKRATEGSAGMDLYACLDQPVEILPHQRALIPTGIAVAPESPRYAAFIYARSGLAIKKGIAPANCVGVVDSDYRGEVCVGLLNSSEEPFTVEPFERIAQVVIAPVELPEIEEVDSLDTTERGAGGFGSTGKK